MQIKKLPTHVHSIDGCKSRASAQHATHDKFTESSNKLHSLMEIKKLPTHVHSQMVADLEHQLNMPPKTNSLNPETTALH
jgi:hypothetical protein